MTANGNSVLQSRITQERHNLFMAEVGSRMVVSAVIALAVLLPFYPALSKTQIALWAGYILSISTVSLLTVAYYNRHRQRESQLTVKWHAINIAMALLWSSLWCMAPFLFFTQANTEQILVFLLIVTLVSSTPSVSMGVYPDIFLSFIGPVFLSLTVYLNHYHGEQAWLIRFIPLITLASLSLFSLYIHKAQLNNIRLRIEAELAHRDAERANRSKNRFLAAISHDLRQPLQAATLYASLIRDQHDEASHQISRKLLSALHSGSELLDQLLMLSHLQSGSFTAHPRDFCLDDCVDKLINESLPQAREKGLRLHSDIEPGLRLYADPLLVTQILRNLLSNAIKYTERGEVRLNARSLNGQVQLSVTDTGIGIDPQRHDDVFDEFIQVDNAHRALENGLGLGLSIVKRLCSLSGASLELSSQLGRGSCFRLSLPAGRPLSADQQAPEPELPAHCTLRIVVVDDDVRITASLSEVLVEWGADVYAYNRLSDALTDLSRRDTMIPDVILCDGQLGEGHTALHVFQALAKLYSKDIPRVLLSGMSDARQAGLIDANATLLKPIDADTLKRTLLELSGR